MWLYWLRRSTFKGNVYDFSGGYITIDKSNIVISHKHLMI